jgi:hypothetical protein
VLRERRKDGRKEERKGGREGGREGGQVPMALTCNPSYQENLGLKPAQANSSRDPILKIPT